MDKMELSLEPKKQEKEPVMGYVAVAFGLLGIFTYGPVFVPLAAICGLLALFTGQVFWGLVALFLALVGLLTSPTLLVILGLGTLAAFWPWA